MDINLITKLHSEGNFIEAQKGYLKFLEKNPNNAQINNSLALLYNQIGEYEKAKHYANIAIKIDENPDYLENLATSYYLQNQLNEAMTIFEKILEKTPKDIQRIRDYASIAYDNKQWEFAIKFYSKSAKLDKNDHIALNNIGLSLEALNKFDEAKEYYESSLKIQSNYSAHHNLGVYYRKTRNFQKSIVHFKKALDIEPNNLKTKIGLGMSYLSIKDFKNGFKYYTEKRPDIRNKFKNHWDGKEHKNSILLIYFDGGRGDIIMFSRYLPFIENKFKKIILLTFDEMIDFLKFNLSNIQINSINDDFEYDYSVNIMDLPYILNMNFDNIPFAQGYLKNDKNKTLEYKNKYFNNNKTKIGLYWEGNLKVHTNRSINLEKLSPLFDSKNCQFYSFQLDTNCEQLKDFSNIIDIGATIKDFSGTASALKNLDILITIDTSIAHLAGSLGVRTFLLLPYSSEWRWFEDSKTTPWYDSIEIFKQEKPFDWKTPIDKILKKLN